MTKDTIDTKDNVLRIVSSNEDTNTEPSIPQYNYKLNYTDGTSAEAFGFLVFTSQHVAVMRDNGEGAIPVLVAPLGVVRDAVIVEDTPQDTLPW